MNIKNFKGSNGFIEKFLNRFEIKSSKIYEKSGDIDNFIVKNWLEKSLPEILDSYKLEEIFNEDEFGFFYKLLPSRSFNNKTKKM